MMKDFVVYIAVVIIVMEVLYRVMDFIVHKANNLAGKMETLEEE